MNFFDGRKKSDVRNPQVYLAGKITNGDNWRGALVPSSPSGRTCSFLSTKEALDPKSVINIGDADIIGPFFVSCDHGCAHGHKTHAVAAACYGGDGNGPYDPEEDRAEVQKLVHAVNTARIRRADLVFACINEVDCFGTIAEIGVAYGAGVHVHLFFGEDLTLKQRRDLWFVVSCATRIYEDVHIERAFSHALDHK